MRDVLNWVLPILLLDSLFLGVCLRLLGLGVWYHGLREGEKITYRALLGCVSVVNWGGLVLISNQRLVVRVLLSRLAAVDCPLTAIRAVSLSHWWWLPTVRVVYTDRGRERSIQLGGTGRKQQAELLSAFRATGVTTP